MMNRRKSLLAFTCEDENMWPFVPYDTIKRAKNIYSHEYFENIDTIIAPILPTSYPNLFQINLLLKLAQCLKDEFNIHFIFKYQTGGKVLSNHEKTSYIKYICNIEQLNFHKYKSKCELYQTPFPEKSINIFLDELVENKFSNESDNDSKLMVKEMLGILHHAWTYNLSVSNFDTSTSPKSCIVFGESELTTWVVVRRWFIDGLARENQINNSDKISEFLREIKFITLPGFTTPDGSPILDLNHDTESCRVAIIKALRTSKNCFRLMNELDKFFIHRRSTIDSQENHTNNLGSLNFENAETAFIKLSETFSCEFERHQTYWQRALR